MHSGVSVGRSWGRDVLAASYRSGIVRGAVLAASVVLAPMPGRAIAHPQAVAQAPSYVLRGANDIAPPPSPGSLIGGTSIQRGTAADILRSSYRWGTLTRPVPVFWRREARILVRQEIPEARRSAVFRNALIEDLVFDLPRPRALRTTEVRGNDRQRSWVAFAVPPNAVVGAPSTSAKTFVRGEVSQDAPWTWVRPGNMPEAPVVDELSPSVKLFVREKRGGEDVPRSWLRRGVVPANFVGGQNESGASVQSQGIKAVVGRPIQPVVRPPLFADPPPPPPSPVAGRILGREQSKADIEPYINWYGALVYIEPYGKRVLTRQEIKPEVQRSWTMRGVPPPNFVPVLTAPGKAALIRQETPLDRQGLSLWRGGVPEDFAPGSPPSTATKVIVVQEPHREILRSSVWRGNLPANAIQPPDVSKSQVYVRQEEPPKGGAFLKSGVAPEPFEDPKSFAQRLLVAQQIPKEIVRPVICRSSFHSLVPVGQPTVRQEVPRDLTHVWLRALIPPNFVPGPPPPPSTKLVIARTEPIDIGRTKLFTGAPPLNELQALPGGGGPDGAPDKRKPMTIKGRVQEALVFEEEEPDFRLEKPAVEELPEAIVEEPDVIQPVVIDPVEPIVGLAQAKPKDVDPIVLLVLLSEAIEQGLLDD